MHINLIAHSQVKTWNPTPECPNQIYPHVEFLHGLFTSCSRSFHMFGYCVVRVFCDNFSGNREDMILRSPTAISDQTNIYIYISDRHAYSGHSSNRWHTDK